MNIHLLTTIFIMDHWHVKKKTNTVQTLLFIITILLEIILYLTVRIIHFCSFALSKFELNLLLPHIFAENSNYDVENSQFSLLKRREALFTSILPTLLQICYNFPWNILDFFQILEISLILNLVLRFFGRCYRYVLS